MEFRCIVAVGLVWIAASSASGQQSKRTVLQPSLMNRGGYVATTLVARNALPAPAAPAIEDAAWSVTVGLCAQPQNSPVKIRLKRSGDVLAEKSLDSGDRLHYEVVIHGPSGDVKVRVPIGANSSIREVYEEHGTEQAEEVVDAIAALGEPNVSVVAIRREITTSQYLGSEPAKLVKFDWWAPYYRVELPDPATPPSLVQVPRDDDRLYRLAKRTGNRHSTDTNEVSIVQISGDGTAGQLAEKQSDPPSEPESNDLPFADPFSSDEA